MSDRVVQARSPLKIPQKRVNAKTVNVTFIAFADGRSVFFESDPLQFHVHLAAWKKGVSPSKLKLYQEFGATNSVAEIVMIREEFEELGRKARMRLAEDRKNLVRDERECFN